MHELEACRALDLEDLREATAEIHIHKALLRVKGDALSFEAEVLKRHAETLQRAGNRTLSWKFTLDPDH